MSSSTTTTNPITLKHTVKLPNGKTITLNSQQVGALDHMKAWVQMPNDYFLTLAGYAGTGKTTLTNEMVKFFKSIKTNDRKKDMFDTDYRDPVCISAPTHKAKKVIGRAAGMEAFTIQKLLGLRPNTELDTFDINNPQFDAMAEKEIQNYDLVIIDEGSMLNTDLFRLLQVEALHYKTKILFMGDEAQLPPVNEPISRIFTDVPNKIQLTKVERQAGSNPLMGIYDRIRSDIRSTSDLFDHSTQTNAATGEGIEFYSSQAEFEAQVLPLFASEAYAKDPDHIKMLAYMNESVKLWNKQIRNHVFNTPTEPLLLGEVLLAYNSVVVDFSDVLIENSADYKVEAIKEGVSKMGIQVYETKLRSIDDRKVSHVNVVRKAGIPKFIDKFTFLLSAAKIAQGPNRGKAWRNYYHFKNQHLLLQDIHDSTGTLLVKKDLDYGYAITVHKSQGSTFTNVAISETNIDRNRNTEERNKLKYVAFSRPTHRAIVFSNKATI